MKTATQLAAKALQWLAVICLLVAWYAVTAGGYRGNVFGYYLSVGTPQGPFLIALGGMALAWLLDRGAGSQNFPLVRLARRLRDAGRKGRWLTIGVFVLLTVSLVSLRQYQQYHRSTANKLFAEGRVLEAADHYAKAASIPNRDQEYMRSRQNYMLYGAQEFERCIELAWPRYQSRAMSGASNYLWLWSCLGEVGRYADGIEVATAAMARFGHLKERAAGVIADFERKLAVRGLELPSDGGYEITLRVAQAAVPEGVGELNLRGNWNASGRQHEIHGWQSVIPMERQGDDWLARVRLRPTNEMPYAAVVETAAAPVQVLATHFFWVNGDSEGQNVELKALPQPRLRAAPKEAIKPGDGKHRVLAIWPDAGSWPLLNAFRHQGMLPHLDNLIGESARGEMISTYPPFTSTAYLHMVRLDAGKSGKDDASLWEIAKLQLKGLPFFDRFFAGEVGSLGGDPSSLFNILGSEGLEAINLVFNDGYVSTPEDQGDEIAGLVEEVDLSDQEVLKLLNVDPQKQKSTAEMIQGSRYFMEAVANSEHKTRLGVKVWQEKQPDFLLLRFPAVDLMSHRFVASALEDPTDNLLLETYRQLDGSVERLLRGVDADDTVIFVSDHGIASTLAHTASCVLVVRGPGIEAGDTLPTVPIAAFPRLILERFGKANGHRLPDSDFRRKIANDVLTAEAAAAAE